MGGPNPSEMDNKVFIPVPTYCLQTEFCLIHNCKKLNTSLIGKLNRFIKIKQQVCETKNDGKSKIFMVFYAHFTFHSLSS